jgi:predicted TIM-barrel fold metal-dependent hydrolase
VIDWHFETYGPRAVATKNQSAYVRRLDYEDVPKEVAAPLFARHLREKDGLNPEETKALQDHLWRYCVRRATEAGLPVKLHTGYYAGVNRMPLARVGQNLNDLCPILMDFPQARFVLMHITYPYQDQLITLAKHFANVYVDMCWAWIMNPAVSVRFLKEYLLAAPANKLFTFGGDYFSVESVYGHSRIARQGIAQALSELVEEGWLAERDALALVEPLMNGNAREVFRVDEKRRVLEGMGATA